MYKANRRRVLSLPVTVRTVPYLTAYSSITVLFHLAIHRGPPIAVLCCLHASMLLLLVAASHLLRRWPEPRAAVAFAFSTHAAWCSSACCCCYCRSCLICSSTRVSPWCIAALSCSSAARAWSLCFGFSQRARSGASSERGAQRQQHVREQHVREHHAACVAKATAAAARGSG